MTGKSTTLFCALAMTATAIFAGPALAQQTDCGTDRTIDIAEMTWPSAAALAHVHAIILEEGFGCPVEIVTGDTVPTSASMLARGRPALAPEMWTGTIQAAWTEGLADGAVEEVGIAFTDGAIEGWFIPEYVAQAHPELRSVEDLPDYAELFADPDEPSQGRFYSCPPGWGCEINNAALFDAYDLESSYNLFSPGSGGNLDAAIARAFTREEPILFYYWGPTALMGKYDFHQLEMPPYDAEIWNCNTDPACEPNGRSSFPAPPVVIAAASWLSEEAPAIVDYLGNVELTSTEMSQMLSWADETGADADETARHFLAEQQDVWTDWVPAEVAERVNAAIAM